MRPAMTLATAALLMAGCGAGEDATTGADTAKATAARSNGIGDTARSAAPRPSGDAASATRWDLQSSGEGVALALLEPSGGTVVRLFCPARANRLLVNVPAFRPVASEERLSFGSGGEVVALVADVRGDAERGGVTGPGEVPANLAALVAGPIGVNYGFQNSGPHSAPPAGLARAFVAACAEGAAGSGPPSPAPGISACLVQDGERLEVAPIRAIGTEPFWGARIEGRCVAYSHPEDQAGTRVWTRYTAGSTGGTWAGALEGQRFELTTRAAPGCSDGMSDRRYPIEVDLLVGGERRRGCAAPL